MPVYNESNSVSNPKVVNQAVQRVNTNLVFAQQPAAITAGVPVTYKVKLTRADTGAALAGKNISFKRVVNNNQLAAQNAVTNAQGIASKAATFPQAGSTVLMRASYAGSGGGQGGGGGQPWDPGQDVDIDVNNPGVMDVILGGSEAVSGRR